MYPRQSGGPGQQPNHQWPQHQSHPDSSQPPPHPSYPASQPPNNGAYRPAPAYQPSTTLPPLPENSNMTALHLHQPQPPPHYQLPAPGGLPGPHAMYPVTGPPHDPYRPPAHMQYPHPPHQPAPRQRTAIACRYCRRRKIRCSGFESNEDGRCTNCARFSQECVFTPVSAQTQAFVPAHTVYRGGAQPPQLYGAYGQPLPTPQQAAQDSYGGRGQQYAQAPQGYAPAQPHAPQPPRFGYEEANGVAGRKRPAAEPHTPTLPPPNPAAAAAAAAQNPRSQPEYEYRYPDPTALTPNAVSPASSTNSAQPQQGVAPQQPGQPYYTNPIAPRRPSPTASSYSYEPSRASSSPNTQGAPLTPGSSTYSYPGESSLRPPLANIPLRGDGRTPPPTNGAVPPIQTGTTNGGSPLAMQPTTASPPSTSSSNPRPGMTISSLMSADGNSPGTRSTTDSNMLNKLR